MIATGLTRRIDNLGRIMLPKAIRSEYGIGNRDAVEIFTRGEYIVIRKHEITDGEIKSRYTTDNVGRIVLPKAIRKDFQFVDGEDFLEIFTEEQSILLKKYERSCVLCNSTDSLVEFCGKKICTACIKELVNLIS